MKFTKNTHLTLPSSSDFCWFWVEFP